MGRIKRLEQAMNTLYPRVMDLESKVKELSDRVALLESRTVSKSVNEEMDPRAVQSLLSEYLFGENTSAKKE